MTTISKEDLRKINIIYEALLKGTEINVHIENATRILRNITPDDIAHWNTAYNNTHNHNNLADLNEVTDQSSYLGSSSVIYFGGYDTPGKHNDNDFVINPSISGSQAVLTSSKFIRGRTEVRCTQEIIWGFDSVDPAKINITFVGGWTSSSSATVIVNIY